ncbi:MAG: ATP-dependent RNA helicase HrpA [Pseudomonadales bacterium]
MTKTDLPAEFSASLLQTRLTDTPELLKQARSIETRLKKGLPCDRLQQQLQKSLDKSLALVAARAESVPPMRYPADLPVADNREEILAAINANQVIIVAGETGSGKTTQLPKLCLEAGRGVRGLIGHTQPRRLAARTVANRIADEMGVELGQGVGYQVRFNDQTSDATFVKLMTDGILLAEVQRDRELLRYDTLIIDEAHERSLNIDFLLGYLQRLLPRRPDLKLIITSATIDVERFSKHFGGAPVISVEGRSYPVALEYLPLESLTNDEAEDLSLPSHVCAAMHQLEGMESQGQGHPQGDVLVFLPGEREIREVALALRKLGNSSYDILPLYARLSQADQQRIFTIDKRRGRRIVLATNVAETSVTVPGIRYVIDSGVARISRYSARSKVQRLPIESVSRASADQRKGRCGRIAPGTCIRLYDEADFENRPLFTDPEILRTNLASVILQMAQLKLGDVAKFPFLDKPDSRFIRDGQHTLEELGALDSKNNMTDLGWQLAKLPIDPRLGRMVLAAGERGCLHEILIIASALSVQDPRENPVEKKQAAQQAHKRFAVEGSDFMSWVGLWDYFEEQRQELSGNQLRKLCKKEFLSWVRITEWRDLHRQLHLVARQLKLKENQEPASLEVVHTVLLSGLVSNIAQRDEGKEYKGTRGRRLIIFPGSGLYKKPPKWMVSSELVETGKLYARGNGRIEPEWVLPYAQHLVKRQYSEPHYSTRRGQVLANESISLYGLVLSDRNKAEYKKIDPVASHEIFVRAALVEGGYRGKAPFWRHNQQLLEDMLELEARSRRGDIRISDDIIYEFYNERVPAEICDLKSFDRWRKKAEIKQPELLFLQRHSLMADKASEEGAAQFPSSLMFADMALPLHYRFEPGQLNDGVTVDLPVALLNRVPVSLFDWLVPGLLRDKTIALLKTLPKNLRKNFVPVPDFADKALAGVSSDNVALVDILARRLSTLGRVKVVASDFSAEKLESFYLMRARIIGEGDKVLAESRDIRLLVNDNREKLQQQLNERAESGAETQFTRWDFGDLAAEKKLKQAGVTIKAFPAIVDCGDKVALRLLDDPGEAERASRAGVVRLIMAAIPQQVKYLRKELLRSNQHALHLSALSKRPAIVEFLLQAIFLQNFLSAGVPRSEADFKQCVDKNKGQLVSVANEFSTVMDKVLALHYQARQILSGMKDQSAAYAVEDVTAQLSGLLYEGFLPDVPFARLRHYPRYLQAIVFRLEKLAGHQQKDRRACDQIQPLLTPLDQQLSGDYRQLLVLPQYVEYRWALEEYRVSLFAQQLGTQTPVSEKRLKVMWEKIDP